MFCCQHTSPLIQTLHWGCSPGGTSGSCTENHISCLVSLRALTTRERTFMVDGRGGPVCGLVKTCSVLLLDLRKYLSLLQYGDCVICVSVFYIPYQSKDKSFPKASSHKMSKFPLCVCALHEVYICQGCMPTSTPFPNFPSLWNVVPLFPGVYTSDPSICVQCGLPCFLWCLLVIIYIWLDCVSSSTDTLVACLLFKGGYCVLWWLNLH